MPRFYMKQHLTKEFDYPISDEACAIFLKLARAFKQLTKNTYLLQYQQKYVEYTKNELEKNPGSAANLVSYKHAVKELIRIKKRIESTLPKKIAQLKIDFVYALHAQDDDPRAVELKIDEILKEFFSYA